VRSVLARGYRPAAAADVANANGKLVHVTFDDAFRSVERALPALERLRVPATVFACPGYADDGRPLAVPELAMQAREHPEELATMRWADLRGLVERGFEVGSHTVTHPHLVEVGDRELRAELRESRQRLEDELEVPCRFLAYPYGEEDERVRAAARASGYDAAFALPGRQAPVDVYAVPRVGIWQKDGPLRVTVKTSTAGRRLLLEPLTSARERWPRLARRRERMPDRSMRQSDS
jgi:peptidoglycan/xylan/chitin deacetylase (PgdA/CDA1 family)